MSEPITILVQGDPHGKGRPRMGKGGNVYTPHATRSYESLVGFVANREMQGREPIAEPVHIDLRAHFKIPVSWSKAKQTDALLGRIRPTSGFDLDNICKAILDGMNGIAFRDDSQVVSINASKVYGQHPFVVATVRPITGSQATEDQSQGEVVS